MASPGVAPECPVPSPRDSLRRNVEHFLTCHATLWLSKLLGCDLPQETPFDVLISNCLLLGLAARHLHAVQAGLPPPALPDKLGFGERPHRHVLDDMTRFQDMCRELGVGPGDLVSLADLQKGRACHRIASCLWDLASILRRGGHAEVPEFASAEDRRAIRTSMRRLAKARKARFETVDSPLKRPAGRPPRLQVPGGCRQSCPSASPSPNAEHVSPAGGGSRAGGQLSARSGCSSPSPSSQQGLAWLQAAAGLDSGRLASASLRRCDEAFVGDGGARATQPVGAEGAIRSGGKSETGGRVPGSAGGQGPMALAAGLPYPPASPPRLSPSAGGETLLAAILSPEKPGHSRLLGEMMHTASAAGMPKGGMLLGAPPPQPEQAPCLPGSSGEGGELKPIEPVPGDPARGGPASNQSPPENPAPSNCVQAARPKEVLVFERERHAPRDDPLPSPTPRAWNWAAAGALAAVALAAGVLLLQHGQVTLSSPLWARRVSFWQRRSATPAAKRAMRRGNRGTGGDWGSPASLLQRRT
ncbi:hypothetical protein ACKKBF_B11915 [Auxenochlorella protothecoides x Auxenochlorella symbiontica]